MLAMIFSILIGIENIHTYLTASPKFLFLSRYPEPVCRPSLSERETVDRLKLGSKRDGTYRDGLVHLRRSEIGSLFFCFVTYVVPTV